MIIIQPVRDIRGSIWEVKPNLDRAIVLPLEGKGDRSAVDEVNIRPAPLRGAFRTDV